MPETSSSWHSTIYVVLPAASTASILMLPANESWSLPSFVVPYRLWLADVGEIHAPLAAKYGIQRPVLRCISTVTDETEQTKEAIYVLEPAEAEWQAPPVSRWISRDALVSLTLAQPEQRSLLETALTELEGAALPAHRPPWARKGWFDEASGWIRNELAKHGDHLLLPVEQVRSWGISAILRANTTRGVVYFKVANQWQLSMNEPLITQTLAGWYPQSLPAPFAIDSVRRWMLMDEFGTALRENPNTDIWEAAIRQYVPLQIDTAQHVEALQALGCADRRLETLPEWIDMLLADNEMLAVLTPETAAQFTELAAPLKATAAKLAEYRLPAALVHGDLHPGNIAVQPDGFLYFDWTDAYIGHPFMDLLTILDETSELPNADQETIRLRDAYLSLWTAFAPMERLQAAWLLAEPLAALHQVISYRNIYRALESASKFEFTGGLNYWVERLLEIYSNNPN